MKLNIVSIPLIEFVVLWLICCTSANVSLKASPLRSSVDYEQMIKRIEAVQASKDMNKMEELAREIQTKWSKVDVDQYSTLMQNICRTMLFSSMGREKQTFPIVEKYSLLALQRKEEIPAATEANFVSYLLAQEGCYLSAKKLNNKDWTSYRVARASISLHALGRIAKKTDPNFDFSKIPLIHAIPPIGAMDNFETPEKIADPKLRSEYEAIIKANDATKAKYSEQNEFKRLNRELVPQEERYVIGIYSARPYNLLELKHLLDTYLYDSIMKERILEQVTKNTAKGQPGL